MGKWGVVLGMRLRLNCDNPRTAPLARPSFAVATTVAFCAAACAGSTLGYPPLGAHTLATLDVSPALAGNLAYVSSDSVHDSPSAATTTLNVAEYGTQQFLGYGAAAPGHVHAAAVATQSIHTLIRELSGRAEARTESTWEVVSELAAGTPIWVQIELSFHGTAGLVADALTGQLTGAAAATFSAAQPNGRSLYSGTGSLSAAHVAGALVLNTDGFWTGALTTQTLATTFQVQFLVPSHSQIATTLEMGVTTHSFGGRSGSLSLDFSNSGAFAFVGATDLAGRPVNVTFHLVPEPGTLVLAGLFGLMLGRRCG